MSTVFLVTLVLILVVYILWKRKNDLSILERHGIKGPKPNFFIGNLTEFMQSKVGNFTKWRKQYGDIFGFYLGIQPNVVIMDQDLIKAILIKDFNLFPARFVPIPFGYTLDPYEKYSITFSHGSYWKKVRTIMRASFSSAKLKAMVPLIDDSVNTFIEVIGKKSQNKEEVDVFLTFQYLTFEVIAKTAFGLNLDCQKKQSNFFLRETQKFLQSSLPMLSIVDLFIGKLSIIYGLLKMALFYLGIIKPSSFTKYAEVIVKNRINSGEKRNDLLQCLIDTRLPINFYNKNDDLIVDVNVAKDDAIIEGGKNDRDQDQKSTFKLTPQQIVPNCTALLAAGFETTRTSLSFITHCLVTNPDVQEKVRDEIKQLLEQDGTLGYNTVTNLPYLDAVIKESLRL